MEDHLKPFSFQISSTMVFHSVQKVGVSNLVNKTKYKLAFARLAPLPVGNLQPLITQTMPPNVKGCTDNFTPSGL